MWNIGVDVGGTFTDLFAWNVKTGKRVTSKVLTTKHDRSEGLLNAIRAANIALADINQLVHGTTTATNALIERSFPDAAMVTTEGFRDVLEIGRMHREHLYRPYQTKPKPIIRRRYRYTVTERTTAKGETHRPLDKDAAKQIAQKIKAAGIQSIAVCFINSYVNADHEAQMKQILLDAMPDAFVVCSGDIPVFREHGRFTTTAIRAALMPAMRDYFDRLEDRLRENGFQGALQILKSSGGLMSARVARDHPEELIESGPAGGVAYAAHLAKTSGFKDILHTDVGGTSFDASIVVDGRGLVTRNYELEWDVPIVTPMLDIHSVGAGGGSIAWVDNGGSLRVGPQSAGSEPGPACYGRGGTQPTMTDANLLLGRLEPDLGDKFTLDIEAAEKAVASIAQQAGISTIEAAEGIVKIGCETMAHAVKMVIAGRGRDPRDFVLASFGGAGPMHACFVAQALAIPQVVVPGYAGVASAFGATVMDLRHDLEAFCYAPIDDLDPHRLNTLYDGLEDKGRALLNADGVQDCDVRFLRTAQMRYVGQTYEVEVPIPSGPFDTDSIARIAAEFHKVHKTEYGVSSDEFAPALVSIGLAAIGNVGEIPIIEKAAQSTGDIQKGERKVYFDGTWFDVAVLHGHNLAPNQNVAGPALIEYDHSCAVLPPGSTGHMDQADNLIITLAH
ncbi:MAG: hydantoinase/oxoprolinase family protein [Pseudomonadota bacterium]